LKKKPENDQVDPKQSNPPGTIHDGTKPGKCALKAKSKTLCTQPCMSEANDSMIQCNKCQGWTHYECTQLPVYQLYLLVHTSRRYTCEACANVTPDFREKWISSQEKTSDLPDQSLEVVKRIENSVGDTIISMHKTNQDEKIQTLQKEIVNTSSTSKRVEHLEKKIEYLTDTTIAKIDNIKDTMTSPDFKLLETKLNKVTSEIEKINHNLDKTCQTLDKTVTVNLVLLKAYPKLQRNYRYNFNMTQM